MHLRLDPASRERALKRLRETLAAHDSGRGVWFGSRAWIVTASGPIVCPPSLDELRAAVAQVIDDGGKFGGSR